MTMSCGLTLQICLIIALSFHSRVGGLVLSMAKSLLHGALRFAHKSFTCGHACDILKERRREERTDSSSWNFFQPVFTHIVVKVHSHQLLRACLLGSKEATISSLSGPTWTSICGLPSKGHAVPWHHVHQVLCQVPEPNAFLVQPVLAAFLEDAVAVHSSATSGAWTCLPCRAVLLIMTFIFPAFTLSPFSSIASLQVKSLLTHSSSNSAMIIRSPT